MMIIRQHWEKFPLQWDNLVIDAAILKSFQIGVALGIIIITTLHFFFIAKNEDSSLRIIKSETSEGQESKGSGETEADNSKLKTKKQQNASESSSIKKRNNLEEVDAAAQHWTPHRRLNGAVYFVIIIAIFFILQIQYKGDGSMLLSALFRAYFPRETQTIQGVYSRKE